MQIDLAEKKEKKKKRKKEKKKKRKKEKKKKRKKEKKKKRKRKKEKEKKEKEKKEQFYSKSLRRKKCVFLQTVEQQMAVPIILVFMVRTDYAYHNVSKILMRVN